MYIYITAMPPTSLDQGWHEHQESGGAKEVLPAPTIFVLGIGTDLERANLLCTGRSSAEGCV